MRYQFIQEHRGQFPVRAQCRVLAVSASGFYAWRQRPRSPRSQANQRLSVQIRATYQENRCAYGSPRIHLELKSQGTRCSEKRVARLMQAEGLRARVPRAFKVTTDSTHDWPVAANLLGQQFRVGEPNRV